MLFLSCLAEKISLRAVSQFQAVSQLKDATFEVDPAPTVERKCLDGWTLHSTTGKCYKKFDEYLSFEEAETSCQQAANSSHLASFSSREEFDFLANMDYQNSYWIGMKQMALLGQESVLWKK
uniref:C-type lectin domain-containing protein n=1 Tax=Ditylenchus dipsaci TaxID=166011 RepID=A0A915CN61_9BILA